MIGILVFLLTTLAATGAWGGNDDLRDIRKCVEANMPRISTIQKLALDVEDGGDSIFEARLTLYWRRLDDGERRIVLRFREPDDLAGASLLIHQPRRGRPTVYLYLPEHGKPRKILSRGELEGFLGRANLGVEEMQMLLEPLPATKAQLLDDAGDLSGRPVWVVEQRDDDGDARYARTVTFFDKEYCVPLRGEFYGRESVAAKVLEIDASNIARVAESWVPTRLVFRDLARKTATLLRTENVEVDTALAPTLLTVESLPLLSR